MSTSLLVLHPRALGSVALLLALAACAGDGSSVAAPTAPENATPSGSSGSAGVSTPSVGVNVMAGATLWVDPASNARRTADAWRATRPADASQLDKIAAQSQVRWFGNWNVNVARDVDAATTALTSAGALPVFVAYNIPQRDCGGLSGDNTTTVSGYRSW